MTNNAAFCVSIDTELIWGRVHMEDIHAFLLKAKKERAVIARLLKLFEKYNIHATWALVGHLFLSSCKETNGLKHPEIVRPKYPWLRHDWFSYDPCSDVKSSSEWYGSDIVRQIQKYPYQEIGSHTFSHLLFNESGMSEESAESDMKAWKSAADTFKLGKAISFVFPQNKIAYLPLLKKYGFKAYRDKDHHWYDKLPKSFITCGAIIDLFMPISTINSKVKVSKQKDLIRIPSSFYFPSGRGIRSYIPRGVRASKAIRGIKNAMRTDSVFHMWFHPTDLVDDQEKLFSDLEKILQFASKMESQGKLRLNNMGELAQE